MGFGPFNVPPHRQNTASFRRFARRRASAAGIATTLGKHSFRAIGIMAYLKNGGTLEKAAGTAKPRLAALRPAGRGEPRSGRADRDLNERIATPRFQKLGWINNPENPPNSILKSINKPAGIKLLVDRP
jgi:hypothetical protein